jgi:hypothetical protein
MGMTATEARGAWWRRGRLVAWAVALAALILGALIVPPWFTLYFSPRMQRQAAVWVLGYAQAAYGITLAATLVGVLSAGFLIYRARRRRMSRPWAARVLLFCGACLVGLMLVEGAAAAFRARVHRLPVLPRYNTEFSETPAPNEVAIVVLGESSALGYPYNPRISIGQIVAWRLGQMVPSKRFHAEVMAELGADLERMCVKLTLLRHRPDLFILYIGHNEFTFRYRWSRNAPHYDDEVPAWSSRALQRFVRRNSPLCKLIQETLELNGRGEPPPLVVTRRLVDVPVCTPDEFANHLADFRGRLEALVAYVERLGSLPVLVIPPGNDAGFEPNRSVLPHATPRAVREAVEREFLAARAGEVSAPAASRTAYRTLLDRYPEFAEAHFRLARLLEQAGAWDEAYRHYVAARDGDGFPMRCMSAYQEAYHEVAARHPSVLLIDGQAICRAASPHGLLNHHLFHDAMHPNLRGQVLLAQAILDRLYERRAFGWPDGTPSPEVDLSACIEHFGIDAEAWREVCEREAHSYSLTAYVRYDPTERLAWSRRYEEAARRIAAGEPPESVGIPGFDGGFGR